MLKIVQKTMILIRRNCLMTSLHKAFLFTSVHNMSVHNSSKIITNDKFAQVVSNAEKIVGYPTSIMSLRCLLSDEMNTVAMCIDKLVGTKHPLLKIARALVFNGRYGMQTRGLIVLLLAKAASGCEDNSVDNEVIIGIHNKQRHLAEIIETIHLACLIHKGIVNLRDLEPEQTENAVQHRKDMESGNTITVLTGDFLLSNACKNLAKLENPKVVEMMSSSIGHMMESNFVYLNDEPGTLEQWEEFTFLSKGSLLANCCACSLKISENEERLQKAAFNYGKFLSYAQQIREELGPFMENTVVDQVNMRSLPVIHYLSHAETGREVTDSGKILHAVRQSDSVQYAQNRCRDYGDQALAALNYFKPCSSTIALQDFIKALTTFPNQ